MGEVHKHADVLTKPEKALAEGQGCTFGHLMEGKTVGQTMDILRKYDAKSGEPSSHLPKLDIGYDHKAGTVSVKPEEKGTQPDTGSRSPSGNEMSKQGQSEAPLFEKSVDPKGNVTDYQCHNQTPAEKAAQPNSDSTAPTSGINPNNTWDQTKPQGDSIGKSMGGVAGGATGNDQNPPSPSRPENDTKAPPPAENPHTSPTGGQSPGGSAGGPNQ